MRKPVLAITAALLGCIMAAPMAYAAHSTGDAKKACADVVDGRATYQSVPDATTPTGSEVLAQMDLGANACKNIGYTLIVLASDTDSTVLATADGVSVPASSDPSVPPRVEFDAPLPYPGPEGEVCIVITTSKSNGKVLDSAPDAGCVPMPIDSDVSGALKFR
jgi:hypothetical protein